MSSILSYITSIIQSLKSILFGFYQNKQGTILLLGLDNAGKTTLLHKLRTNTIVSFSPTERPHCETFYMNTSSSSSSSSSSRSKGGIKFVGWDLGGHEAVRHLWDDYCMMDNIDAVIFMIDAVDYHRLEEVRDELDALVHGSDGSYNNGSSFGGRGLKRSGVPLAILLNKCDLEDACSSEVVAECIGLGDIIDGYYDYHNNHNLYDGDDNDNDDIEEEYNTKYHNREMVQLFRISVWKGEGYVDAFEWIASFL